MRINVGIRRRLAPLVENSRRRIELLHGAAVLAAGHAGPLLRRRDRDGRQHLPRRPQRRAHADAVDQRPQRRLLARRSRAPLRAADHGPGLRLPGDQRRGAGALAVLAAELDEADRSRCAGSTAPFGRGSLDVPAAGEPEGPRVRPRSDGGRDDPVVANLSRTPAARRARPGALQGARRRSRCPAGPSFRGSASSPYFLDARPARRLLVPAGSSRRAVPARLAPPTAEDRAAPPALHGERRVGHAARRATCGPDRARVPAAVPRRASAGSRASRRTIASTRDSSTGRSCATGASRRSSPSWTSRTPTAAARRYFLPLALQSRPAGRRAAREVAGDACWRG